MTTKTLLEQIDDLQDFHQTQAEHFAPFGANNALTVFHTGAAATLSDLRPLVEAQQLREAKEVFLDAIQNEHDTDGQG